MLNIIKYLRSSFIAIILIIVFLIIQALCDLALPDYTSRIVNVGIQQGGIESTVPKVMRQSTYFKIKLFVRQNDKKLLDNNYKMISKQNLSENEYDKYLKQYPSLINEPLYILRNPDDMLQVKNIVEKPIISIFSLESNSTYSEKIKAGLIKNQVNVSDNADIFQILSSVNSNISESLINSIEKKFDNFPESIKKQSIIEFLRMEYIACGIDIDKNQINYIVSAGIKMLLLALLSMMSVVSVVFVASRIAAKLGRDLRSNVYSKVLYFSSEVFERFSTSSLITRTTNDITQVQTLLVMLLRMVFYAPILGIGGLIKVIKTNRSMTWTIGVAILAILIVVTFLFVFAIPQFKRVQKQVDKLNAVSREILTGLPVIRAFANEENELQRFDIQNRELTKTNLYVNRLMMLMMPAMMFIMNAVTILIVYVGSRSINNGVMQVGDLIAFISYSMQIVMAFLLISMVSVLLPRAVVCANRIDAVLSAENTVNEKICVSDFLKNKKGIIEFRNVSFKYPDSEKKVLENISFTAKANKITAIIGSTGSGKSTLIKLIPRMYDVSNGSIFVDGINVKDADMKKLRSKIGFVPQKAVLFSGTIFENLKFGNPKVTREDVRNASDIAQCSEFIQNKENKFDSYISQGGSNFSGGQKQRLSIARAIAKKPEILIFDDSFSALDYKTDIVLRTQLKNRIKNCTYIIVAQRISTVKDADNIIVLDKGKICGSGTHDELMKNCEVYKQIALSQLSKEELEK